MKKSLRTPEQIKVEINRAMAKSDALDGDCKECQVRRVSRLTEEEVTRFGRNWNVDMFSGECRGECLAVLAAALDLLGKKYEAIWP